MVVVNNNLIGKWCVPDHPHTCANPAPWPIEEVRIEERQSRWVVLVRNASKDSGSMWFHANDCYIDSKANCEVYCEMKEIKPPESAA